MKIRLADWGHSAADVSYILKFIKLASSPVIIESCEVTAEKSSFVDPMRTIRENKFPVKEFSIKCKAKGHVGEEILWESNAHIKISEREVDEFRGNKHELKKFFEELFLEKPLKILRDGKLTTETNTLETSLIWRTIFDNDCFSSENLFKVVKSADLPSSSFFVSPDQFDYSVKGFKITEGGFLKNKATLSLTISWKATLDPDTLLISDPREPITNDKKSYTPQAVEMEFTLVNPREGYKSRLPSSPIAPSISSGKMVESISGEKIQQDIGEVKALELTPGNLVSLISERFPDGKLLLLQHAKGETRALPFNIRNVLLKVEKANSDKFRKMCNDVSNALGTYGVSRNPEITLSPGAPESPAGAGFTEIDWGAID